MKELTNVTLNPIINQSTNAALKIIDTITKAGFQDYSMPTNINKVEYIPDTKIELLESINSDPTNIKLHRKLVNIYKDNFEITACKIHEEIIEMLNK